MRGSQKRSGVPFQNGTNTRVTSPRLGGPNWATEGEVGEVEFRQAAPRARHARTQAERTQHLWGWR